MISMELQKTYFKETSWLPAT